MSVEKLMMCINERSTSFFDSMVTSTGGQVSTVCFKDIIRCSLGMINSSWDQELVMFVYLDQGNWPTIEKQLLNMVYMEIPDNDELVRKVSSLKSTTLFTTFFKGTRTLDDMLRQCAYLALKCAMVKTSVSVRDGGRFIGCGKDMYISHFQEIVETITDNLANRLHRAERRIIESIYGKS